MSVAVEIAVQDEAGLVVAAHAGADRVELCIDLEHGGSTPPLALVEACVSRTRELLAAHDAKPQFGVHVLIRPPSHARDFLGRPELFAFSDDQVEAMVADAAAAVAAGAHGVVIGALAQDPDGTWHLDEGATERIRDAALEAAARALRGITVACHRCVDALPDAAARAEAVRTALRLGLGRVLTSGGAERALDGAADIAAMVEASEGIVDICAGGGVRPADIAPLVRASGATDIHLSGRQPSGTAPDAQATLTDPAVCTAAVDAAGAL